MSIQSVFAQQALWNKTVAPKRRDHYAEGTPPRDSCHHGMFPRGRFRRPLSNRLAFWSAFTRGSYE